MFATHFLAIEKFQKDITDDYISFFFPLAYLFLNFFSKMNVYYLSTRKMKKSLLGWLRMHLAASNRKS